MSRVEVEHHERVLDQTLSMYSDLRDRGARRVRLLNSLVLVLSAILCGTTFLDEHWYAQFHLDPKTPDLILRVCSVAVFTLSIWILSQNFDRELKEFTLGAEALSSLKLKCRYSLRPDSGTSDAEFASLAAACSVAFAEGPRVPEREFSRLKAKHVAKIALSRAIDDSPGVPVWILKIRVLRKGLSGPDAST
jgi:hypothetical protein